VSAGRWHQLQRSSARAARCWRVRAGGGAGGAARRRSCAQASRRDPRRASGAVPRKRAARGPEGAAMSLSEATHAACVRGDRTGCISRSRARASGRLRSRAVGCEAARDTRACSYCPNSFPCRRGADGAGTFFQAKVCMGASTVVRVTQGFSQYSTASKRCMLAEALRNRYPGGSRPGRQTCRWCQEVPAARS
jgi:hypothetical protein